MKRNRIKQNKFNVMPYFNKFKINGPNKAITEISSVVNRLLSID